MLLLCFWQTYSRKSFTRTSSSNDCHLIWRCCQLKQLGRDWQIFEQWTSESQWMWYQDNIFRFSPIQQLQHGSGRFIYLFVYYKVWQKYNVYICYMNHNSKCIHYIFARLYIHFLYKPLKWKYTLYFYHPLIP